MQRWMQYAIGGAIVVALLATAFLFQPPQRDARAGETITREGGGFVVPEEEIMTTEDGTRYTIHPRNLKSGGPPKDGIPSIDNPQFVSAGAADWLTEEELGIGLEYNGAVRFYPYRILVFHEIANDEISGEAVLVTYCPLCFTAVAFKPFVPTGPNDSLEAAEFGVSGLLYNSELVMYDRKTDSYWPQTLGRAVVGPLTGYELEKIPIDIVTWGKWKQQHPDTEVLSRDTGLRPASAYDGSNPYGPKLDFSQIGFVRRDTLANEDDRLPQKESVYGLEANGAFRAYEEDVVREEQVINDAVDGTPVLVVEDPETGAIRAFSRHVNNETRTFSLQNGALVDDTGTKWTFGGSANGAQLERLPIDVAFWFAWAGFHPNTTIYGQ